MIEILFYENSQLFANYFVSELVSIMSTFGPLSFVITGLFLGAMGPSPAVHPFGAASAKNSGGGVGKLTSFVPFIRKT